MVLFRYLHLADQNPAIVREIDKMFENQLDFKYIKFPVKIRGICNIEQKNCIDISVFGKIWKTRNLKVAMF